MLQIDSHPALVEVASAPSRHGRFLDAGTVPNSFDAGTRPSGKPNPEHSDAAAASRQCTADIRLISHALPCARPCVADKGVDRVRSPGEAAGSRPNKRHISVPRRRNRPAGLRRQRARRAAVRGALRRAWVTRRLPAQRRPPRRPPPAGTPNRIDLRLRKCCRCSANRCRRAAGAC